MNLLKYKYIFFAISLLVIIPGVISLALFGLKLSIDFTGGSLLEVKSAANQTEIREVYKSEGAELTTLQQTSNGTYLLRSKDISDQTKEKIVEQIGGEELRFETVGPVIGQELTIKAFQAVGVASVAIILYIAYAFRQIPAPYSPWKFGIVAVIALLHDALVVVGIFSILGHFFNVEIDSLFVTALLTVIGFSVHDTIVVFDRVRENLRKNTTHKSFEGVVNESLVQTLGRSLTTSLTVLFTLLALILFGGESVRWFIVALFIGMFSGTLSSIFTAAPLLVVWQERGKKKN